MVERIQSMFKFKNVYLIHVQYFSVLSSIDDQKDRALSIVLQLAMLHIGEEQTYFVFHE